MIALLTFTAALTVCLGGFSYTAAKAVFDGAKATREHTQELIAGMSAERSEWAKERAVLLNRIQDPAGTAYISNVELTPPAVDVDMVVTR